MGIDGAEIKRRQSERDTGQAGKQRKPRGKKVAVFISAGIFLCISLYLMGSIFQFKNKLLSDNSLSTVPSQKVLIIKEKVATIVLGNLPDGLDLGNEASELLNLISQYPGKDSYQITYLSEEEMVRFASHKDEMIERLCFNLDKGKHTSEIWRGNTTYRLEQAIASNSLNSTPSGEVMPERRGF